MPRTHSAKKAELQKTTTDMVLDQQFHIDRCALCERNVKNPCVNDLSRPSEGLAETQSLPVPMTDVVRAKAKVELLAQHNFCGLLRHLNSLKLTPQEVIHFTCYKIFEGLYHGVRYEWPWGEEMEIGPDTIEEAFSGRPEVALPAHDGPWDDEPPIFYGRAIATWLGKAAAGEIKGDAHDKWHLKLLFADLGLSTPNFDPKDVD